jgi:two-component system response regulator YesN
MDTKSDHFKESSFDLAKSDALRATAKTPPRTSHPEIHAALRRLQQWAANTSPTGLTRKQAASIASREPHYLSYLFRREMGKTFVIWRREYRTSVAIAALKEGRLSIDEIVKLVGYRSRRSLERAVKEATGRTAGSFKRKQRSEPGELTSVQSESI